MGYVKDIDGLVEKLLRRTREHYRDRLVSFVVFGSVARGVPRPDSDIDFLIVADNLSQGRIRRVSEFAGSVEQRLEKDIAALRRKGISICLSPLFKTRSEVEKGSPLFLDMTFDARILHDKGGFFQRYLAGLNEKLRRFGSRRVQMGNAWYWVLKPDYKPGEVIEL